MGDLFPTARVLSSPIHRATSFWDELLKLPPHSPVPAIPRIRLAVVMDTVVPPKHQPQAAWGPPGTGHRPPSSPIPPGSRFPPALASPDPQTQPPSLPHPHIPPCCPSLLIELAAAQTHPSLIFTVHQAREKTQRFSSFFFFLGLNLYLGSDLPILPLIPQRLRAKQRAPSSASPAGAGPGSTHSPRVPRD